MGQEEGVGLLSSRSSQPWPVGETSCSRRAVTELHEVGCDRQVLTGCGSPRRVCLTDWGTRGGFMEEVTVELGLAW